MADERGSHASVNVHRLLRTGVLAIPLRPAIAVVQAHPDLACLMLLLLLGGSLRLALLDRAPVFIHGDSPTYYAPAAALLRGEGFPLDLKRTPLYSAFIALIVFWLGEDLKRLVAVQHLLGLGTVVLTYGIGRLIFGWVVGLLAGVTTGLSAGLLLDEHSIMSETLFTFLLLLAVALCLLALRREGRWWYLVAGLAVSLAALTRPHAQLLLLLTPLVAIACGLGWRRAVRGTTLLTLGALVLLLPWMARNQVTHGSFTVVGGLGQHLINQMADLHSDRYVFYNRFTPSAHADARRVHVRKYIQERIDKQPRTVETTGRRIHARLMQRLQLGDLQTDALMRDVAVDILREQPLTAVRATGENLRRNLLGNPEGLRSRWGGWMTHGWPQHLKSLLHPPTAWQTAEFATTERLIRLYDGRAVGGPLVTLFFVGLLASLVHPAWRLALLPGAVVVLLHGLTSLVAGYEPRHYNPTSSLLHVVAFGGSVLVWRGSGQLAARALSFWNLKTASVKSVPPLPSTTLKAPVGLDAPR